MQTDPLGIKTGDRVPTRDVRLAKRNAPASRRAESGSIDWTGWLRLIERKRRVLSRLNAVTPDPAVVEGATDLAAPGVKAARNGSRVASRSLTPAEIVASTYCSFKLDGWDVTQAQVAASLCPANGLRATPELRSRQAQRLRNHASILHHIESSLRVGESLKSHAVVRWFTHVSSGLTTSGLDDEVMMRLDQIVRRINSPQLRLQPALHEISALHAKLMTEPLMPSYNGIVCRLLLRYHLGRCNLPPVIFDPATDGEILSNADALLRRLLTLIDESYARLLSAGA